RRGHRQSQRCGFRDPARRVEEVDRGALVAQRSDSAGAPLLEMRSITKRFPGVTALRGVSLSLERGEVLALTGENGAGKSTLMKVLCGAHAPDEGELFIDG